MTLKSSFRAAFKELNQTGGLIESTFTQPEESIDSESESSHPPKRVSFENFDLFASVNDNIYNAFGPRKANHWKALLELVSEVSEIECAEVFESEGSLVGYDFQTPLNYALRALGTLSVKDDFYQVEQNVSVESCQQWTKCVQFLPFKLVIDRQSMYLFQKCERLVS